MTKQQEWFNFNRELRGIDIYKNGKFIPRFIIFWNGITAEQISTGQIKNIEIRER